MDNFHGVIAQMTSFGSGIILLSTLPLLSSRSFKIRLALVAISLALQYIGSEILLVLQYIGSEILLVLQYIGSSYDQFWEWDITFVDPQIAILTQFYNTHGLVPNTAALQCYFTRKLLIQPNSTQLLQGSTADRYVTSFHCQLGWGGWKNNFLMKFIVLL